MKLIDLLETKIKLTDLYDQDELDDESEAMYSYIDTEDLDREFAVHTMTPEEAKTYTTPHDDTTVWEAFNDFASKQQKKLVMDKAKRYDYNRIILVFNKTVLDGNHHLVAAIFANKPIKYINLAEYS